MLIINDDEVKSVLTMANCIEAMETAFAELGKGEAVSHPRQRYKAMLPRSPLSYTANIIAGAVPSYGVAALRYDSIMKDKTPQFGASESRLDIRYPKRRSWGFVLLFSLESGEPLAVIQDFSLSSLRVGATTAIALKRVARSNSKVVGLFGSGNQARRNLEGAKEVLNIGEVRVYSPNPEHRETFAREQSPLLDISIEPAPSAEKVLDNADIVMCATNSALPVFDPNLLEAGQTVTSIVNNQHLEINPATFLKSDRVVINQWATIVSVPEQHFLDLIENGNLKRQKIVELPYILEKGMRGRANDRELVTYWSNSGMGIQFAAAGQLVYKACVEKGLGREIPTDWFGTDVSEWLEKGFYPAP